MILGIYGSGGMGRELADVVLKYDASRFDHFLFIDDVTEDTDIYGLDVVDYYTFKKKYSNKGTEIAVAQGEPTNKEKLYNRIIEDGYKPYGFVHPSAEISPTVKIGKGVFIEAFCCVSSGAIIEDNVYMLANSIVGHDCIVGSHSQVSSMVSTGGGATIGKRCFIGMSSSISNHVRIGDDTIVSQGAIVMRDTPKEVIVMGNPSRVIQRNEDKRVFRQG